MRILAVATRRGRKIEREACERSGDRTTEGLGGSEVGMDELDEDELFTVCLDDDGHQYCAPWPT
jgi:hypothetical protein